MRSRKVKEVQPNLGMLLLLEEILPEWNKLLDRQKNLGLPPDKANPLPASKRLSTNAADDPMSKKNVRTKKRKDHEL